MKREIRGWNDVEGTGRRIALWGLLGLAVLALGTGGIGLLAVTQVIGAVNRVLGGR